MSEETSVDELFQQAKAAVAQKQFAQAIALCRQGLEIDESRTDLHSYAAMVFFRAKDYQSAIGHYKKILLFDPADAKTLINLGAVYNRLEEFKNATEVIQQALQKDRNSAEAYYNLGIAYRGQSQVSMAMSAYREALRLNPELVEAHQNIANLFMEMNNSNQAITHYRKALELRPEFAGAKRGLSRAMNINTKEKEAESPFGRLVDPSQQKKAHTDQNREELTGTEREQDRKELLKLAGAVKTYSKEFLSQVKEELGPAILALNRALAQASDDPFRIETPFEELQQAWGKTQEIRNHLRRKMLEIQAHEELINTPKVKP